MVWLTDDEIAITTSALKLWLKMDSIENDTKHPDNVNARSTIKQLAAALCPIQTIKPKESK